jgi:hypothetical protein
MQVHLSEDVKLLEPGIAQTKTHKVAQKSFPGLQSLLASHIPKQPSRLP